MVRRLGSRRVKTPIPKPRVRLFCDDWEQASQAGDLTRAVESGAINRVDVTQLGDVIAGTAPGREHEDDITIFDSTGLAIQDLAIAITVVEKAEDLGVPMIEI